MNGSRYLLDTNAIIQLLKGNTELAELASEADFLATSIIAEFEYLSFTDLPANDVLLYRAFRSRIRVFDVPAEDPILTHMVTEARTNFKLKLPDAIIAATARANGLAVLTADDHFRPLVHPWQVRFFNPATP